MHRKFIALIVSAAITVTGLSLAASPARADDTTNLLAGLAALALIGAAIHNSRDDDAPIVSQHTPHYYGPVRPNPQPPRFTRFDLPQYCLLPFPGYNGRNRPLLGEGCLKRYYGSTASLPQTCNVTFWNGRDRRSGYDPVCLQQRGYRLARR